MNIGRSPSTLRATLLSKVGSCSLILVLLLIITPSLQAATDDVALKTKGFGNTYQEALNSALLTSIQQVRGLEAGTTKGLRFDLNAITAADTFIHLDGKIEQTVDTYTRSRGWIKSYTVLEVNKPADKNDTWQVTINAIIPMYKQVIPEDKRQTIAIIPFHIDGTMMTIDGHPASPSHINRRLTDAIQSTLVQNQHYAVLNRNFEHAFKQEQQLWASGSVNPTEASRLGEQLGADFMLLGRIDRFTLNHRKKELHGVDFGGQKAEIELTYQLTESATGKIIWANQKRWFKAIDDNKNLFTQDDEPHPLNDLIQVIGHEIALDLLKATAPPSAVEKINTRTTSAQQQAAPRSKQPSTPGASDAPVNW